MNRGSADEIAKFLYVHGTDHCESCYCTGCMAANEIRALREDLQEADHTNSNLGIQLTDARAELEEATHFASYEVNAELLSEQKRLLELLANNREGFAARLEYGAALKQFRGIVQKLVHENHELRQLKH